MDNTDHHKRHSIIWVLLRPFALLYMKIKYKLEYKSMKLDKPSFIVCNHNNDLDPGFIVALFRTHVYFVASEHIYRWGLISSILKNFQPVITRQKGGNAAGTVKAILRTLKKGYNVCLFPEGNRSWDGVTRDFLPSTGKLARSCGAQLVTCRTHGAYFASPRWSGNKIRKGPAKIEVVNIYSPEQLKELTPEQINELIAKDIYEDAYAEQRKNPQIYKGKNLAEHMETLLFICPSCKKHHSLVSHGNSFSCKECGYTVNYLQTGFLDGDGVIFDNIRDWNVWQDTQISEICNNAGSEAIFTDDNLELHEIKTGCEENLIDKGRIALFKDYLELPGKIELKLNEITGMALVGPTTLFVGTSEHNYQIKTDKIVNTNKYLTASIMLGCNVEFGV